MIEIPLLENFRRICCRDGSGSFRLWRIRRSIPMGLMNAQPYCQYFGRP
jgi:hypothetical protein